MVALANNPLRAARRRRNTIAKGLALAATVFGLGWLVLILGVLLYEGVGGLSLAVFACMLTLVETDAAGRAFAAYGGVYIFASLLWLWAVDGVRPDRWDIAGVCICLLGAAVILLGPRSA